MDYTAYSERLTFSDDSQIFVNYGANFYPPVVSFIWEMGNDAIESTALLVEEDLANPIPIIDISSDKRYIAYAQDGNLSVYDRETNEYRDIDEYAGLITLVFREDGSLITITAERGYGIIKTYTPDILETGDLPDSYEGVTVPDMRFTNQSGNNLGDPSQALVLSPDANILATYRCGIVIQSAYTNTPCETQILVLVDTRTAEVMLNLNSDSSAAGEFRHLMFSPDGQYFALSYCATPIPEGWDCEENQGAIEIWRVVDILAGNPDPLITLTDIPYSVKNHLVVYEDGSLLVTTTNWEEINTNMWRPITRFWSVSPDGITQEVYSIEANNVAFSPDRRILIVMIDNQMEVWVVPETLSISSNE
jgi:WD40 repeat protein